MKRTEFLREIWKMRFERTHEVLTEGKLTQEWPAMVLGYVVGPFVVICRVSRKGVWKDCYRSG